MALVRPRNHPAVQQHVDPPHPVRVRRHAIDGPHLAGHALGRLRLFDHRLGQQRTCGGRGLTPGARGIDGNPHHARRQRHGGQLFDLAEPAAQPRPERRALRAAIEIVRLAQRDHRFGPVRQVRFPAAPFIPVELESLRRVGRVVQRIDRRPRIGRDRDLRRRHMVARHDDRRGIARQAQQRRIQRPVQVRPVLQIPAIKPRLARALPRHQVHRPAKARHRRQRHPAGRNPHPPARPVHPALSLDRRERQQRRIGHERPVQQVILVQRRQQREQNPDQRRRKQDQPRKRFAPPDRPPQLQRAQRHECGDHRRQNRRLLQRIEQARRPERPFLTSRRLEGEGRKPRLDIMDQPGRQPDRRDRARNPGIARLQKVAPLRRRHGEQAQPRRHEPEAIVIGQPQRANHARRDPPAPVAGPQPARQRNQQRHEQKLQYRFGIGVRPGHEDRRDHRRHQPRQRRRARPRHVVGQPPHGQRDQRPGQPEDQPRPQPRFPEHRRAQPVQQRRARRRVGKAPGRV